MAVTIGLYRDDSNDPRIWRPFGQNHGGGVRVAINTLTELAGVGHDLGFIPEPYGSIMCVISAPYLRVERPEVGYPGAVFDEAPIRKVVDRFGWGPLKAAWALGGPAAVHALVTSPE